MSMDKSTISPLNQKENSKGLTSRSSVKEASNMIFDMTLLKKFPNAQLSKQQYRKNAKFLTNQNYLDNGSVTDVNKSDEFYPSQFMIEHSTLPVKNSIGFSPNRGPQDSLDHGILTDSVQQDTLTLSNTKKPS